MPASKPFFSGTKVLNVRRINAGFWRWLYSEKETFLFKLPVRVQGSQSLERRLGLSLNSSADASLPVARSKRVKASTLRTKSTVLLEFQCDSPYTVFHDVYCWRFYSNPLKLHLKTTRSKRQCFKQTYLKRKFSFLFRCMTVATIGRRESQHLRIPCGGGKRMGG